MWITHYMITAGGTRQLAFLTRQRLALQPIAAMAVLRLGSVAHQAARRRVHPILFSNHPRARTPLWKGSGRHDHADRWIARVR